MIDWRNPRATPTTWASMAGGLGISARDVPMPLTLNNSNPRLASRRPVDVLDKDPDKVIEAAKGEDRVELF